ncbi:MAG: dihydroorotase [Bacteroidetes bacterium]|nr:dihydroorotase [Bacteroidota bacterium]
MNILIQSATIIDAQSPFNGKQVDILVKNGVIEQLKKGIKADKNTKVISAKNLHVSAGWFDMQANLCDPGFEYKEDINSGIQSAAQGGFTHVAVMPSTNPTLSSKAQIEYVLNKAKGKIVAILPIGSISENQEGKDIAELYDMHQSGAIAFSDDKKSMKNSGLLIRALQYAQLFKGSIITYCNDSTIAHDGKMNESATSTSLGLKGLPALAEEVIVQRNIAIAEYCNAALHIGPISTKKSVEQIKEAKKKKLKITASVNAYNLLLDDSNLTDFNTNCKVLPPLRSKEDIAALKKGIAEGTINCITSDHSPEDTESKNVEFDMAAFGMIGLETAFAVSNTALGKENLSQLINAITVQPRAITNQAPVTISEKSLACLTLFDPSAEWTVEEKNIKSKSKNTPFIGAKLTGKVIGIINNNQVHLNS